MRRVGVLGVGMTKFGITQKTNLELFAEASLAAIEESGLTPGDMQALFLGNALGDFEEGQMHMAPFAAAEIGMPASATCSRFEAACATATIATRNAILLVGAGVYDLVLVAGVERAARMGTELATTTFAMATDAYHEAPTGLTFPGVFAMACHMYAHKYGIPLEVLKRAMAQVAVKNHKNGVNNPLAQFQKEISQQTVLAGPMIADPLQLFDCCPFSDGAAAAVIACEEKARQLMDDPVWVLGTGQATGGSLFRQRDITRVKSRELASAQAYKEAGIGPDQVDVVELHDCFSIAEIMATEGLGFFEFGRGYLAAAEGKTALNAQITINPSGGLKAKGHPIGATGLGQVHEIVKQLRGQAGKRQVDGARIGYVDTLGGDLGTTCNIILGSK